MLLFFNSTRNYKYDCPKIWYWLYIDLFLFPSPSIFHTQACLSAIRKILDVISDFSLVYVHHPLLLKFFLQYPDLMGRFGYSILQLWFSCEDFSQTEYEDAATRGPGGFSDSSNNFNSLICMLKANPSAILVLLVSDFSKWTKS